MSKTTFTPGQKVNYVTTAGQPENGIVKSVGADGNPFVVYKCGGNWERYMDYTGARTNASDLRDGWVTE